ncbi:MAG: GntR family transcriptional regulator [Thermodesulfovibrionales bacterium]
MERTLDRESQQKLYVQLIDIIKEKIKSGEWAINTMIPTEDELCNTFSVSKTTVRIAVSELVREGLLKRQQGKGTFVTSQIYNRGIPMKILFNSEKIHGSKISKKTLLEIKREKPASTLKSIFQDTDEDILHTTSDVQLDSNDRYTEELFIPISNIHKDIKSEDIVKMSAIDFINENSTKKVNRVIQTIEGSHIAKKGNNTIKIESRVYCGDNTPIALIRETTEGRSLRLYYDFEKIR